MKKLLIFLSLCIAAAGFADDLILQNHTSYPDQKKSKIAVQWASSAKEVDEGNYAAAHELKMDAKSMQTVKKTGTVKLSIPKHAEYFRVLIWSTGKGTPDLLTNWVDVVPNKTYTLENDHLVPTPLMLGTGC